MDGPLRLQKTVNLQAGERLLALQAASSPMSPISIITDMDVRAFEVLPVKPGQQVSIAGSRIIISSPEHTVSFGCLPKKVCCTRLTCPPGPFPCKELLSQIRQAIASSQAGIFRLLFCDSTEGQAITGKEEYSLILPRPEAESSNAANVWNSICTEMLPNTWQDSLDWE